MTTFVRLCIALWCLWYMAQFVHWTAVVVIGVMMIANEIAAWTILDLRKRVAVLEADNTAHHLVGRLPNGGHRIGRARGNE